MSLTRIDFQIYRGPGASIDSSSFIALNPSQKPGSLVLSAAAAVRESIGSQVACKLSLEHFVTGVLDYFDARQKGERRESVGKNDDGSPRAETSLEVLEAAFKNANSSVYNFGHKLAAGGRMAASLIGLVIEDHLVAAGRVGHGSSYLFRQGDLFPFFDNSRVAPSEEGHALEAFVGANSLVAVELASVPIEESDTLLVFPRLLTSQEEEKLQDLLREDEILASRPAEDIAQKVLHDANTAPYVVWAQLGPQTIYLDQVL